MILRIILKSRMNNNYLSISKSIFVIFLLNDGIILFTIFKIVIIISTVPIPQPKSVLHLYGYLLL